MKWEIPVIIRDGGPYTPEPIPDRTIAVFHGAECACAICHDTPPTTFAARVTAEQFRSSGVVYEHYRLPEARDRFYALLNMQRTGDEPV
jgi:hypothetical protein